MTYFEMKEDSIADRYLDVFDIILQIDELDCTNQPLNIVKHVNTHGALYRKIYHFLAHCERSKPNDHYHD